MKKRIFAFLLCIIMSVSVLACGNDENAEKTYTVAENVKRPEVTTLSSIDPKVILKDNYKVTEEAIMDYYYSIMFTEKLAVNEVKDRAVKAGDIVLVDYVGYLDDKAFSGGSAADQYLDVDKNCGVSITDGSVSGYFIDGFTSGLVGAEIGKTISYDVTFPKDYGAADLKGKTAKFEFKIKGIYDKVEPEDITDEFVEKNLKANYEVSTKDEFMKFCEDWVAYYYAMNFILSKSVVEIPDEYLNARFDLYYEYLVEYYGGEDTLRAQCVSAGYTLDEAKASWKANLKSLITEEAVFTEIVKKQKLKQDTEWFKDYMDRFTAAYIEYWEDQLTEEELTPEAIERQFLRKNGFGDVVAAKNYFMNQKAVREHLVEKYNAK